MLNIAVIGAGRIGHVHAKTIAAHPGATLALVADPFGDAASKLAEVYGARHTTDVDSVFTDEGVDAEVRVDLGWLGLDPGRGIRVHDELTGQDFDWGAVDYVRLWPAQPAHVLSVSPVQL